eukprot:363899-Chlamydomonas_euryale.AAC.3
MKHAACCLRLDPRCDSHLSPPTCMLCTVCKQARLIFPHLRAEQHREAHLLPVRRPQDLAIDDRRLPRLGVRIALTHGVHLDISAACTGGMVHVKVEWEGGASVMATSKVLATKMATVLP